MNDRNDRKDSGRQQGDTGRQNQWQQSQQPGHDGRQNKGGKSQKHQSGKHRTQQR